MTYDEARTRKVAAEAAITELELSKVRNELAMVSDVVKAWDDVLSAIKAKLLALPTRMGPILAAETDANLIEKQLELQLRDCLDELSNYEPLSDAGGKNISIREPEFGDEGLETASKVDRKPVGRPKKASKLSK